MALAFEERQFSLADLDALANGMAWSLSRRGVTRGSRVALMSSNRPEFVVALREKIGRDLLWLPGSTAVVLRRMADPSAPIDGASAEELEVRDRVRTFAELPPDAKPIATDGLVEPSAILKGADRASSLRLVQQLDQPLYILTDASGQADCGLHCPDSLLNAPRSGNLPTQGLPYRPIRVFSIVNTRARPPFLAKGPSP